MCMDRTQSRSRGSQGPRPPVSGQAGPLWLQTTWGIPTRLSSGLDHPPALVHALKWGCSMPCLPVPAPALGLPGLGGWTESPSGWARAQLPPVLPWGWPEAQLPPPWAQADSTDSLPSMGAPDLCISRAPSRKPRPWPKKGQIIGTGGRISVDRSSKATLPLTIPRPIFKSSAKDSSPRSSGIAMQSTRARLLPPARGALDTCFWERTRHSY